MNSLSLVMITKNEESNNSEYVSKTGSYLAYFNLGIYYELVGDKEKCLYYYKLSSEYNYLPALNRLKYIKKIG